MTQRTMFSKASQTGMLEGRRTSEPVAGGGLGVECLLIGQVLPPHMTMASFLIKSR